MIFAHLTEARVENYQNVVQEIFHIIGCMNTEGPQQKQVKEQTKLEHIQLYIKQIFNMSLASKIVDSMLKPYLKPKSLIYGSNEISVRSWYNANNIVKNLQLLQLENMRLILLLDKFKPLITKRENWYKT